MKEPVVLIVDDEPGVLKLARMILERAGFRVLGAGTGEDALKLCAEHAGGIDGVLLDVMLPDTPGLELAPQIRAALPGAALMFMGGYPSELVVGSKQVDAPFLQKPFEPRLLVEVVNRMLNRDEAVS